MGEDRNASNRPPRPVPESLNRLLIVDPNQPIEWVEDPLAGYLKPDLYDRVLRWFSIVAFGAAAFITSATMTVRLLQ
jgi:hypothetical protein